MSEYTKRKIAIFLAIAVIAGTIKLVFFPSDEKQLHDLMDRAFSILETKTAMELPAIVKKAKGLEKILTDPIFVQFNVGRYPKAIIQTRRDTVQKFIQAMAHIDMVKTEKLNLSLDIESPKATAKLVIGFTFKTKSNADIYSERAHLDLNFRKVDGDWLITEFIQRPFKEDAGLSE